MALQITWHLNWQKENHKLTMEQKSISLRWVWFYTSWSKEASHSPEPRMIITKSFKSTPTNILTLANTRFAQLISTFSIWQSEWQSVTQLKGILSSKLKTTDGFKEKQQVLKILPTTSTLYKRKLNQHKRQSTKQIRTRDKNITNILRKTLPEELKIIKVQVSKCLKTGMI